MLPPSWPVLCSSCGQLGSSQHFFLSVTPGSSCQKKSIWFFGPKRPSLSKINITCSPRAPDKPRFYAWAHLGCLTLKWCYIRNRRSKRAELFCHNRTARHFQAFGDFTTLCTVSPGLVPLTHYVMIFQGWETNCSLRKIWQPIYTPKL